jgi:hypothetical protein
MLVESSMCQVEWRPVEWDGAMCIEVEGANDKCLHKRGAQRDRIGG